MIVISQCPKHGPCDICQATGVGVVPRAPECVIMDGVVFSCMELFTECVPLIGCWTEMVPQRNETKQDTVGPSWLQNPFSFSLLQLSRVPKGRLKQLLIRKVR